MRKSAEGSQNPRVLDSFADQIDDLRTGDNMVPLKLASDSAEGDLHRRNLQADPSNKQDTAVRGALPKEASLQNVRLLANRQEDFQDATLTRESPLFIESRKFQDQEMQVDLVSLSRTHRSERTSPGYGGERGNELGMPAEPTIAPLPLE